MPSYFEKIVNVFLRSLTLISKFALLFFIARFLEPSELGIYGLLAASIGYALFFVGFEFYTYTTRELIGLPQLKWGGLIRDQVVFFLITYLVFFVFIFFVFHNGWLPWAYFWWFLILLIFEHFAQEVNRLLVIMSEQLFASIVLFIRSGFWCLIVIGYMLLVPQHRSINVVLWAWAIGGFLACALGISRLLHLNLKDFSTRIDWQWIRNGIGVALPFLLATLAIRGLFTFDRYWIKNIAGLEILGAYVLFIGIANAIISFLDSGVVVFMYPRVISDAKKRDSESYNKSMKSLLVQTICVLVVLSGLSIIGIHFVLDWLGKPIYNLNLKIFFWLIAAIAVFGIGMVPQIGLYACNKDKPIITSHIVGLLVFIISVWASSDYFGVMSVPYSLFLSLFCILMWKSIAYFRMKKDIF